MKINRFFGNFDLSEKSDLVVITDPEIINQLKNVLRMRPGDVLALCDGKGGEAEGAIDALSKDRAEIRLLKTGRNENEPKRRVTLCLSVLKRENFEIATQKAVEAGVFRIVPIRTDRTIKKNLNGTRLGKILKEAAEQSGRGIVPELWEETDFRDALEKMRRENCSLVVCDAAGKAFRANEAGEGSMCVFVGPEGGWTKEELDLAAECGAAVVSLGKLTLRAETAAIVASYLSVNGLFK